MSTPPSWDAASSASRSIRSWARWSRLSASATAMRSSMAARRFSIPSGVRLRPRRGCCLQRFKVPTYGSALVAADGQGLLVRVRHRASGLLGRSCLLLGHRCISLSQPRGMATADHTCSTPDLCIPDDESPKAPNMPEMQAGLSLDWCDGRDQNRGHHDRVAKYDPLMEHLCRADDGPVEMTFEEIDRLVGGLPASATTWPGSWANETAGSRHVQAHAWLNSGREVEFVDRRRGTVRFSAARWRRGS